MRRRPTGLRAPLGWRARTPRPAPRQPGAARPAARSARRAPRAADWPPPGAGTPTAPPSGPRCAPATSCQCGPGPGPGPTAAPPGAARPGRWSLRRTGRTAWPGPDCAACSASPLPSACAAGRCRSRVPRPPRAPVRSAARQRPPRWPPPVGDRTRRAQARTAMRQRRWGNGRQGRANRSPLRLGVQTRGSGPVPQRGTRGSPPIQVRPRPGCGGSARRPHTEPRVTQG